MNRFFSYLMWGTVLGSAPLAAQQAATKECRLEIVQLCGKTRDRQVIRACLQEKSSKLSAPCKQLVTDRLSGRTPLPEATVPAIAGKTDPKQYDYGQAVGQNLDFYRSKIEAKVPLIVFIHGGAWMTGDKVSGAGSKPELYTGLGFAFASLNYRLIPTEVTQAGHQLTPDDQARDIAMAIAFLRKNAHDLGFDPDSIFLMGHSAGAHLAALISTQPRYLTEVGMPLGAIRGTVLLDGAGYDVGKQIAFIESSGRADQRAGQIYSRVFGTDSKFHSEMSPVSSVAPPNTENWLILYVASRDDSRIQSEALAKGLLQSKANVTLKPVPNSTHQSVNKDAGVGGTLVADSIAAFLDALRKQ